MVKTKNGAANDLLDASTYLERQIGSMTLPPDRKADVEIDILGYKEAGGVKFHGRHSRKSMRVPGPVQTIVVYTKAIEVNVPIDDAIFVPPAPPRGRRRGPPRGAGGSTR